MSDRLQTADHASLDRVLAYHDLSKHDFHAYAPGPGRLDWASQPNPFRRYNGSPIVKLELDPITEPVSYHAVLSGRFPKTCSLSAASLSRMLRDSLSLSAWKSVPGVSWPLRVNPSSGNLHPTEAYLVVPEISGLASVPSLFHYASREHALEFRARLPEAFHYLAQKGSFFIILSSILWRESWKYGERAFRYCQHDVGHAVAAISVAASALGWKATLRDEVSTQALAGFLQLEGTGPEAEHAECLIEITPRGPARFVENVVGDGLPDSLPDSLENIGSAFEQVPVDWTGTPNRLGESHVNWPNAQSLFGVVKNPGRRLGSNNKTTSTPSWTRGPTQAEILANRSTNHLEDPPLRKIVHQRRSAVDFDAQTGITAEAFYEILFRLMPGSFPFSELPHPPRVGLALFVHRVEGLDPGLYFLARSENSVEELRSLTESSHEWIQVETSHDLPLYRLAIGDARSVAKQISCHQDIAADGCFSLGMIARFEKTLREEGAWNYPRLYWECGMIGQILYLEAEALGIRGTGIGCFFDNPMHELLGLKEAAGRSYQSLYHFTVGGPVEDPRLSNLPPYPVPEGAPWSET